MSLRLKDSLSIWGGLTMLRSKSCAVGELPALYRSIEVMSNVADPAVEEVGALDWCAWLFW